MAKVPLSAVILSLVAPALVLGAVVNEDIQAVIDRELASGRRTILIPKSVYSLDPGAVASIYLKNAKDVTIDFQGSELRGKIRSGMIRLDGCDGVTLKNAIIDYSECLPFTEGIIMEVGPDGEWDVEIADGYPDAAGSWPIQVYDRDTGDLVNPMRLGDEKITRTGERRFSVTGGKDRRGDVGDVVVWSFGCETFGNTQSIGTRAHAVYLVGCRNCRMEDIVIHSTPGSNGFRELLGDGGNAYLRCSVVPRPQESDPVRRALPRYRSGNHDAFNSRGMKTGPKLIDCVARNHCDDDVNIHGPYQFVASAEGRVARAFVKDMYAGTLKVGDPVQFITKDGYVPLVQPVVSAIRQVVPTESELAEVKTGLNSQVAAGCNTMVEVTFDRDCDELRPGSLFVSQNQNGNGFLLQGCHFGPNRARGFICNASFGTVLNCTFDRLEQQGVLSRPSYHWLEGGASRNVRFKDCTFIDCGVSFGVHREMETTPDCHRNIAFAGCKFKGSRARLDVRCCRGFAVDDNAFDLPAEKAMSLTHVEHAVVRRLDYGEHPKQHMMFMRPEGTAGRVPVKVRIHGGGWQTGYTVDHELFPILDSVVDGSAAVVAVQYRTVDEARGMGVNPPVKGVYDDCCAAVRYLQVHSEELGIDPKRISIYGGSAGACAALMMALKDSNPLGLLAIHANVAQTTLDPKEIDEILPGFRYGGHAFGLPRASEDFLRRRDEFLPMIREWSPLALLRQADSARLPPMYFSYSHRYADGRVPAGMDDDRVHDAAFGDLFIKACKERGVKCSLTVAGRREHPRLFPITNQNWRATYPDRVTTRSQLRGVMLPIGPCKEDDFRTLRDWGATLARYQMTRDFLAVGKNRDLDDYDRWLDGKLDHLEHDVLPWAAKYGIKIVVDLHCPPGGRDPDLDWAMYHDTKYAEHFIECWRRIAARFKGRPEIYGFDLVNEPAQTRMAMPHCDYWTLQSRAAEAVREIDPDTTVIVESNSWDSPAAFSYLSPLAIDNVIYEVHVYDPQAFTHQGVRKEFCEKTAYPDKAKGWDKNFIRRKLEPVRAFEKKHGAKIYVGEFSAISWAEGAENYIRDCISLFEEYGWDWTYHAFREWNGWSVEHDADDRENRIFKPSEDNPRKKVLLNGFHGKQ